MRIFMHAFDACCHLSGQSRLIFQNSPIMAHDGDSSILMRIPPLPSIVAQLREDHKDTNDKLDLILRALGQGGTLSGAKGASSGGFRREGNPESNVDDANVSPKGSFKRETVEIRDQRDENSSISRGKVAARLREQFDEVCV